MSNKSPLDEYAQSKEAAKQQRKEKEHELWRHWMDNGQKPEHLEPLLKLYEPTFSQKVTMWKAPNVPESAFRAELMTHAINAFKTYDPSRGAALGTHVENRLKKAHRYNNRFQNIAYIPEGQSQFIQPITSARDTLKEDLGRDPTHHEISTFLKEQDPKEYGKLSPKRVETIMKSMVGAVPMGRSAGEENFDYTSGTQEPLEHAFEDQQIAVAKNILPDLFPNKPELHTVFHHTFGTNDHEKLTTGQLAKKMGKTDQQISRMKTQVGTTLRKAMGLDREEEE